MTYNFSTSQDSLSQHRFNSSLHPIPSGNNKTHSSYGKLGSVNRLTGSDNSKDSFQAFAKVLEQRQHILAAELTAVASANYMNFQRAQECSCDELQQLRTVLSLTSCSANTAANSTISALGEISSSFSITFDFNYCNY